VPATTANNVHFDQYLALLKTVYPEVNGLIAFNGDARLIWHDSDNPVDPEQLEWLLDDFVRGDSDAQFRNLPDGAGAELIKLKNPQDHVALIICLCSEQRDEAGAKLLATRKTFILMSEVLLADYSKSVLLADKENELVQMTDELTRRYEELNLIYKAEGRINDGYHGRELLRQLVLNTARFLSADIMYLYIADRNISMRKFRNDDPIQGSDALFKSLRKINLADLESDAFPLLVSQGEEKRKLGIDENLLFGFVASPVVDDEEKTIGLLAIANQRPGTEEFSDSDRNLLEVMAKKVSKIVHSHFDALTGLENSHSFEMILRDLLRQSHGREARHAIANIDVDRMAVINDISGRSAGDHIIKVIARKLSDLVRHQDMVVRLGSDKFGVLLRSCNLATAETIMKKVSYAISSLDIDWEGKRHNVSISIGITPVNPQIEMVTNLLDAAETAREVSKQHGRNNIHVLDNEDSNLLQRKEQIRWVARIQEGLRDNRFQLFAQLIEPMHSSNNYQHYEILLRLREKDGAIIEPGAFISAAENFYLMANLDLWVINQAFCELATIQQGQDQYRCRISINLSGQSLGDANSLASYVENKLEQYKLKGSDICFEITESTAIANLEEAQSFISQIRELGCKFSLDDFGTGLSSFSYLKNLNVDYLKIDGSFVRDIVKDPVSESMVAAINQVGHAMCLETVAEYVETRAIKSKLAQMGIDYGQGLNIGMPTLFRDIQEELARSA
jgi:diguanylate cyclase (GGDEF)-like protein